MQTRRGAVLRTLPSANCRGRGHSALCRSASTAPISMTPATIPIATPKITRFSACMQHRDCLHSQVSVCTISDIGSHFKGSFADREESETKLRIRAHGASEGFGRDNPSAGYSADRLWRDRTSCAVDRATHTFGENSEASVPASAHCVDVGQGTQQRARSCDAKGRIQRWGDRGRRGNCRRRSWNRAVAPSRAHPRSKDYKLMRTRHQRG